MNKIRKNAVTSLREIRNISTQQKHMQRRTALKTIGTAAATALMTQDLSNRLSAADAAMTPTVADKVNHAACRWCYSGIPLEDLCKKGKEVGLSAIDLLAEDEWAIANKYGLTCPVALSQPKGYGIPKGFNRFEHHDDLIAFYEYLIPKAANAGVPQVICFSGNREGLDDELGISICAAALRKIVKTAEKHKVIVTMELLNSKVDHGDYQCDHTNWGVELVKAVGSDQFKLLYDIYHMQIMEGDIIRTIRDNHQYISHYHTGGVPGRHEIDTTQELHYPAIMQAIVETGYKGFVAQEFIPTAANPLDSLAKAVKICSVAG
jgi:hydroxypyruvate isomerase